MARPDGGQPDRTHDIDQLVVISRDKEDQHVPLFSGMSPSALRDRVGEVHDDDEIRLLCGDAKFEEFTDLCRRVWPDRGFRELPATEPGTYRTAGRVICFVTDRYFRAIAKIAFHYYLSHSRRGFRGDEQEFAPIRTFILEGGDKERFFGHSESRFRTRFGELASGHTITPNRWAHLLAAADGPQAVFVHVDLFIGPGVVSKAHNIHIADLNRSIVLPAGSEAFGHVFEYWETQPSSGHAGRASPAAISTIR